MVKRKLMEVEAAAYDSSSIIINEEEDDDKSVLNNIAPGYWFLPTNEELIVYYLKKKASGQKLPPTDIRVVELYEYHPRQLSEMYKLHRATEWYFFTPRYKKYPNGNRPDRKAGNYGFWKASGADKRIESKGKLVGWKKVLSFYEGEQKNQSKEKKTNWIMHEFRLEQDVSASLVKTPGDMKLDDWVLCMIRNRANNQGSINKPDADYDQHINQEMGMEMDDDDLVLQNKNPQPHINVHQEIESFQNANSHMYVGHPADGYVLQTVNPQPHVNVHQEITAFQNANPHMLGGHSAGGDVLQIVNRQPYFDNSGDVMLPPFPSEMDDAQWNDVASGLYDTYGYNYYGVDQLLGPLDNTQDYQLGSHGQFPADLFDHTSAP